MARDLVEKGRAVLHFLLGETVAFVAGVDAAEARPEAAILLARTCEELLSDAVVRLPSAEWADPNVERARAARGC